MDSSTNPRIIRNFSYRYITSPRPYTARSPFLLSSTVIERLGRARDRHAENGEEEPSTLLTPVSRAAAHLARSSLSITKRKERDCLQSTTSAVSKDQCPKPMLPRNISDPKILTQHYYLVTRVLPQYVRSSTNLYPRVSQTFLHSVAGPAEIKEDDVCFYYARGMKESRFPKRCKSETFAT